MRWEKDVYGGGVEEGESSIFEPSKDNVDVHIFFTETVNLPGNKPPMVDCHQSPCGNCKHE